MYCTVNTNGEPTSDVWIYRWCRLQARIQTYRWLYCKCICVSWIIIKIATLWHMNTTCRDLYVDVIFAVRLCAYMYCTKKINSMPFNTRTYTKCFDAIHGIASHAHRSLFQYMLRSAFDGWPFVCDADVTVVVALILWWKRFVHVHVNICSFCSTCSMDAKERWSNERQWICLY